MAHIRNESALSTTPRIATMPRLRGDLRDVNSTGSSFRESADLAQGHDESLIVDARSSVSPAQMVENKLSRMLKDTSMPVSHLQMRGLLRAR